MTFNESTDSREKCIHIYSKKLMLTVVSESGVKKITAYF